MITIRLSILGLVFILVDTACNPNVTPYSNVATSTIGIQTTTSGLITNTPIITSTFSPSPTPIMPTQTSSPFLSHDGAAARMEQWLEGSPECRFPCWGGMTPGMTNWDEANSLLESTVNILELKENITCTFGPCNGIEWEYLLELNSYRRIHGFVISDSTNLIYWIYFSIGEPDLTYRLDKILPLYGVPDKVFVSTYPTTLAGDISRLDLILIYSKFQFIILYSGEARLIGRNMVSCISDNRSVGLNIHPPIVGEWTDDAIKNTEYSGYDSGTLATIPFKPLEEVTDFTIEKFYEEYKSIEGDECIVTSVQYWL